MQLSDYSPPDEPSLAQQEDALQKGLGRVLQWARMDRLDKDALLAACLNDLRFDRQIDHCRGPWLWDVMVAANLVDELRDPLWRAFEQLPVDECDTQSCMLAEQFVAAGDTQFLKRLYEFVEQQPTTTDCTQAELPLIRLEGEPALRLIAGIRGQHLQKREWDWSDRVIVDEAIETFGEPCVTQWMNSWGNVDERRFCDAWQREAEADKARDEARSKDCSVATIPLQEVLSAAELKGSRFFFLGWSRTASDADLRCVVEHLLASDNETVIANLLRLFWFDPLPYFDERLLALSNHKDERVRRNALNALERLEHPKIRELALSRIADGLRDSQTASLFIKNFIPGDAEMLLDAIIIPDNINDLHSLWMELRNVLVAHPECDDLRLALSAYALTPCASCRHRVAKLLIERHAAPEWLVEECQDDCEPDTRALADTSSTRDSD